VRTAVDQLRGDLPTRHLDRELIDAKGLNQAEAANN
jgi:hypothetical protein